LLETPRRSGDNIGDQVAFKRENLIFDRELALFQSCNLKLIARPAINQRRNGSVKIAVIESFHVEPGLKFEMMRHLKSLSNTSSHLDSIRRKNEFEGETAQGFHDLFRDGDPQGGLIMNQPHMIALESRHAALDKKIASEKLRPSPDTLLLAGLKKQKLKIKEALHLR
jgi:uncharacterized protein